MSNLPPDQNSEDLEDSDKTTKPRKSRQALKRGPNPEPRVSLLNSPYAVQSAPYKTFLGSAQQHNQDPSQRGAVPMSYSPTAYQSSSPGGASIPWSASPTQTSGFQGNSYQPVAVTSTQYPQHFFYTPETRTFAAARPVSSTSVGGQSAGSARIKVEPGFTMTGSGSGPTADTTQ